MATPQQNPAPAIKKNIDKAPAQSPSLGVESTQKSQDPKRQKMINIFIGFIIVLAGLGTGWGISGRTQAGVSKSTTSNTVTTVGDGTDEAGLEDEETFRDTAEGVLMEGGIEGEGTHHLNRGLGPEKDVYLTSTVIDMSGFVGKNVKVWGETITAKKAGWLMDVGKIKVIK